MPKVRLNRLELCGDINYSTPLCVLKELSLIYKTSSVFIAEIRQKAQQVVEIFFPPRNAQELNLLIEFVNPHENWETDKLYEAYSYMTTIVNNPADWLSGSIGLQTNHHPDSQNACVLYAICKKINIPTFARTTMFQMKDLILNHIDGCKFIDQKIKLGLASLSTRQKNDIYSYIMAVSEKEENEVEEEDSLDDEKSFPGDIDYTLRANIADLVKFFEKNKSYALMRINPLTREEAIYFAAVSGHTDISSAVNPIAEFNHLKSKPCSEYVPKDKGMLELWSRNRNSFNLLMNFNPSFPEVIYPPSSLKSMALFSGFEGDQENYYNFLCSEWISSTFYQGKHGVAINNRTIIGDDIDEFKNEDVVSYGSKITGTFYVFTYGDLAASFEHTKTFQNPHEKDFTNFEPAAIKKLKNIALNVSLNDRNREEKDALIKSINLVDTLVNEKNAYLKAFRLIYGSSSPERKKKIFGTVKSLMELGFYMRGWKGSPHPFPIEDAKLTEDVGFVFIRVTEAINKFKSCCQQLDFPIVTEEKIPDHIDSMKRLFLNLPILIYNKKFVESSEQSKGITIEDRLNISSEEDENNESSCIRLTSNWFIATAYKLYYCCNEDPGFQISSLCYTA